MQSEWFHVQLEMAKFEKAAKEEEIEERLQEYSQYEPKKFDIEKIKNEYLWTMDIDLLSGRLNFFEN